MIYTYHSNEINILKRITYLILKNNNFKKGTILLLFPHKNFLKIIKIFLLKKYIIHNNIKFMLHNEILNFILNIFLPKKINNIFSKNFFYWKIVNFLSIYNNYKKINNFKNFFLKKILKKSILKFSDIVSDIFFKYLLYKPNIINNWIKNKYVKNIPIKEQNWQIYLLKKILIYKKKIINFNYFEVFKKKKKKNNINKYFLPKKIFIFNTNNLSISYINLIKNIEKYCKVYIFFLNPCYFYWGVFLQKYNYNSLNDIFLLDYKKNKYNNYLLDLWGKIGRKQLNYLISIKSIENFFFLKKKKKKLLNKIQKNILEFNNKKIVNYNYNYNVNIKKLFKLKDDSIKINICDSKQKEIEILYKYLYKIFKKNNFLKYHDVVVLSKDINKYYPYIKNIFGKYNKKKNLPFSVIGHKFNNIIKNFNIIKKIIKTLYNNYYFENIIDLLNTGEIYKVFKIKIKYLNRFKNFFLKIQNKYKNFKINKINFFYFIKKKILNNKINYIFCLFIKKKKKNIFFEEIENKNLNYSYFKFIKNIINFINCLNKINLIINKNYKLYKFKKILDKIIKKFFLFKKNNIKNSLKYIKIFYYKIIDEISLFYKKKISIKIIQKKTEKYIYDHLSFKQKIILGCINFCNIENIKSISFKITCILGIHNNFYKKNKFLKLNFINYNNNINFNYYNDDKYTFLEILIYSNYKLYISYIKNILDNNKINDQPNIIKNLFNYIVYLYCMSYYSDLEVKKIKKILFKKIFNFYKTIYVKEKKNYIKYIYKKKIIKKNIIYNNYKNFINIKKNKIFINCKINKNIILKNFKNFWNHPIKYFFKKRLNIDFNITKKNMILDNKCFFLNYNFKKNICLNILNYYFNKNKKNNIFKKQQLLGLIPFGTIGKIKYNNYKNKIKKLFNIIKLFPKKKKKYININFKKEKININGYLKNITNNGLRKWKNYNLSFSDGLVFWLEHLIYCFIGGKKYSFILGLKNSYWIFSPINSKLSKKYLLYYIKGYLKGIQYPLLLLLKSGGEWLKIICDNYYNKKLLNKKILIKAKKKMICIFKGYKKYKGDINDPYINRVIDNLNDDYINNICKNSIKWMLPFLYNHINAKKNKKNIL